MCVCVCVCARACGVFVCAAGRCSDAQFIKISAGTRSVIQLIIVIAQLRVQAVVLE